MKKYSDQELESFLDDIESDRVERKESFRGDGPQKIRQTVCAFANDLPDHKAPGILIVGAKDDGSPSGEPVTDQLMQNLAAMKSDGNILPLPVFTLEKRRLKGGDMAVLHVFPSDMPPVKFKGRIWVRTGSTLSIANEQEERILNERRRHKNLPYDLYPVAFGDISALSRTIFENEYLPAAFADDVLEANNRRYEERLASCKMIVSTEEPLPTVTGILALGKNPQDYLPGAHIQFLRIQGKELSDEITDEEVISGTLVEMLRRGEEKFMAHNQHSLDVTSGPTHQNNYTYPPAAVRQILYNAVLHRTYEGTHAPVRFYWFDDRIEIHSPGGPFGNVTAQNFGEPGVTDYRNPNIAEVLKTYGYIQAFGRGIAIAREGMRKNGNPLPEFQPTQSTVLCILRRAQK